MIEYDKREEKKKKKHVVEFKLKGWYLKIRLYFLGSKGEFGEEKESEGQCECETKTIVS